VPNADVASHVEDFYHVCAEVFLRLYAAFPVPELLLVEDIRGPIAWDITGIADRKSRACFETLIWLERYGLLTYRTCEPRNIGIEGAALTQQGFVLLTEQITWVSGETQSRISALKTARKQLAYDDIATLIDNILRSNCAWSAPRVVSPLPTSTNAPLAEVTELSGDGDYAH
jgi:hypothetical protein